MQNHLTDLTQQDKKVYSTCFGYTQKSWQKMQINTYYNKRYFALDYCSDFRYKSNGIFKLAVRFFLQTNFDFLIAIFDEFFYIIQKVFSS